MIPTISPPTENRTRVPAIAPTEITTSGHSSESISENVKESNTFQQVEGNDEELENTSERIRVPAIGNGEMATLGNSSEFYSENVEKSNEGYEHVTDNEEVLEISSEKTEITTISPTTENRTRVPGLAPPGMSTSANGSDSFSENVKESNKDFEQIKDNDEELENTSEITEIPTISPYTGNRTRVPASGHAGMATLGNSSEFFSENVEESTEAFEEVTDNDEALESTSEMTEIPTIIPPKGNRTRFPAIGTAVMATLAGGGLG